MNAEYRRAVQSYWDKAGLSFALDEVVGRTIEGKYCKLNDSKCAGVAGFTRQPINSTSTTTLQTLWMGYIDLVNDLNYPVKRSDLYRDDLVYFKTSQVLTSNPLMAIPGSKSVRAKSINGAGYVTIEINP